MASTVSDEKLAEIISHRYVARHIADDSDVVSLATELQQARKELAALRAAAEPFALLGNAMTAQGQHDTSPWATAPDETPVRDVSNYGFTFGNFRQIATALTTPERQP